MRTLLILNEDFKIPDNILLLFKNKIRASGFIVLYNGECIDIKVMKEGNSTIIIDGIISNLETPIIDEFFWEKNPTIDGQFNIFNIQTNSIKVVTDFINVNRYAYGFLQNKSIICNNLDIILEIKKFNNDSSSNIPVNYLDSQALLQSLSYHYSTFNNRTLIKDVSYFQSGSIQNIDRNKFSILGLDHLDRSITPSVNPNFDHLLRKNALLINEKFDNVILPISGGVDSRLTLYSFFELIEPKDKEVTLLTHGENEDIEVRLAKKLTKILNVKHLSVSIRELYGSSADMDLVMNKGWNWILGKWIPVLNELQKRNIDKNTLLIFGSTFDIFRAKYVKSIRSRKQRILLQLGFYRPSRNLTIQELERQYEEKIILDLTRTFENYKELFEHLNVNLENLINEFKCDFSATSKFVIELFKPNNVFEFEEGLNFMTWGRGAMGSQARLLNQYYPCYVLDANRILIKEVLLVPFMQRFEDKLLHRILRKSKLSTVGTSQIPFIPYSYPIVIKYVLWAFRSYTDQYYMKLARRWGFKKNRLFTSENWQLIYSKESNMKNYRDYFEGIETLMSYPLNYYENRASGKSRALSEIDLTNAAQIALILKKMGLKQ